MLWVQYLLSDLGVDIPTPMQMYCDNQVAIVIANESCVLWMYQTYWGWLLLFLEFINEETNYHTPFARLWSIGWYFHKAFSLCLLSTIVFLAKHVWFVCSSLRGFVRVTSSLYLIIYISILVKVFCNILI